MDGAAPHPHVVVKESNLPFVINEYTFTTLIGKGGFAEVYLVTHNRYQRQFVAKVMTIHSAKGDDWRVFESEVSALSELDHPNIVRLYDHFQVGDQFYLILQCCSGGSLHEEIRRSRGLTMGRFVQVGRQVVSALRYCHEKGIAHRDIKPGNILIDEYGGVKLADFGLSLRTVAGQMHKRFGGSFVYTAPEIFEKKLHDPMPGDVWALGVVFAMMATGKSPWPCESVGGLKKLVSQGNYHLRKQVPEIISNLISRMIVVDPSKRMTMRQLSEHSLFARPVAPRVGSFRTIRPQVGWKQMVRSSSETLNTSELWTTTESSDAMDDSSELVRTTGVHSASCLLANPKMKPVVRARMMSKNMRPSVFHTFAEDDVEEI